MEISYVEHKKASGKKVYLVEVYEKAEIKILALCGTKKGEMYADIGKRTSADLDIAQKIEKCEQLSERLLKIKLELDDRKKIVPRLVPILVVYMNQLKMHVSTRMHAGRNCC